MVTKTRIVAHNPVLPGEEKVKSMKYFVDKQTGKTLAATPVSEWTPKSRGQKRLAESCKAIYIFTTGDNRGRLPDWTRRIIKDHGCHWKKIGRTTYVSNTFAIYNVPLVPS